jgi:hypothetical protein
MAHKVMTMAFLADQEAVNKNFDRNEVKPPLRYAKQIVPGRCKSNGLALLNSPSSGKVISSWLL